MKRTYCWKCVLMLASVLGMIHAFNAGCHIHIALKDRSAENVKEPAMGCLINLQYL